MRRPIDVAATAPLLFTAPSQVLLLGQTITLTATSGTFYEVQSMDVGATDFYTGRVYGSGPTPATLFRDLDDPAPFQNFVVLPGSGGKQAQVTIPTTEPGSALPTGWSPTSVEQTASTSASRVPGWSATAAARRSASVVGPVTDTSSESVPAAALAAAQ